MVGKIFWESLSIALLLYGSYLAYVFIWFSLFRIFEMDITTAKLISGSITLTIIVISSIRWFIKKHKELKVMENDGQDGACSKNQKNFILKIKSDRINKNT